MKPRIAKFCELEVVTESIMKNIDDYFNSHKVLYLDVQCPSKKEIRQYLLAQGTEVENTKEYLTKITEDMKLRLRKHKKLLLD